MLLVAYIGPGAGFTILSSFLMFFMAFLLGAVIFVTAPLRAVVRLIRRRRLRSRGRFGRVVVVGLDGMSPLIARRMIDSGQLPHFAALEAKGTFQPLESTLPPISPAAWSTFQTGTQPDRHNIFDFLACDRKRYLPVLSSVKIEPPRRVLRLGRYRIPLSKPTIALLRKSQPFWKYLGDHGVPSIVLRVPVTFPPEKFRGMLLSGMCVPDLRGTQGSFTCFTTEEKPAGNLTESMWVRVTRQNNRIVTRIPGPTNPLREDAPVLQVPMRIHIARNDRAVELVLPGERLRLEQGHYSPWVRLTFRAGLGVRIRGICRFYLKATSPEFTLYMSPLNIDPEIPVLPISHPFVYASYLAKVFGPYATLGLAEDTWALDEGVLDEAAFLQQCYDIHRERETMLMDALEKGRQGMVTCVFDITDRLQHTFWQYTPEARAAGSRPDPSPHADAVEECYRRMDDLIGRVMKKLSQNDLLLIVSDHGFAAFHTGVNLNAWLHQNGLLALRQGETACEGYFKNVDWSATKAYAMGLSGIFINQAGREGQGTVQDGKDRDAVIQAIAEGLRTLVDPRTGKHVVNRVYDVRQFYQGPYRDNAPDLIIGFADGYRVSWKSVTGGFAADVLEPNEKAWSGDHCIDRDLVPGVLFANQALTGHKPGLADIAPTVLAAFGVPAPAHMQGRSLLTDTPADPRGAKSEEGVNHGQSSQAVHAA